MNIKNHRTVISIVAWERRTSHTLWESNKNGCYATPEQYGKRIYLQLQLYHKALYKIGVYTSFAVTRDGQPIFFTVKDKRPFFYGSNKHSRIYLNSDALVKYFKDDYYTPMKSFCPYIPDYLK